jgi:putative aminopeptidase FrvX
MMYSHDKVELIKALSNEPGPSGFEDGVLEIVRRALEDICTFEEDKLRNLYIYRKNHSGEKPVLMLDAHGDEVGFMIHSLKPNGTLRFVKLGSMDPKGLAASQVMVRTVDGEYIRGIIGLKPPHFSKADAGTGMELHNFSIDIGAGSAEEAANKFHVAIGEPAVPATVCHFDEKHGLFFGKAFDCRIGIAAMIETIRSLDGMELPFDVVAVVSAQEEVGDRGITVAVNKVRPDIAICFEGCPADDTFTEPYAIQTALKGGPMFRYMDVSVICSPRFQRWVLKVAKEHGIKAQASVREGGGNNGAVINIAGKGIPVVVAGVPVRYIHSASGITAYEDFENTAKLATILAKELTPELLDSF